MNLSGQAVFALQEYFKVAVQEILVVHDDIDIEFGKVRTRSGGGEGGHNGLKSVSAAIGEEYARLRIGVANKQRDKLDASEFVLKNFSRTELKKLPDIWPTTNEYIMKFIDGNFKPDSKTLGNSK
jgi:PTH1 family peptidyl-tRNA hydrolase